MLNCKPWCFLPQCDGCTQQHITCLLNPPHHRRLSRQHQTDSSLRKPLGFCILLLYAFRSIKTENKNNIENRPSLRATQFSAMNLRGAHFTRFHTARAVFNFSSSYYWNRWTHGLWAKCMGYSYCRRLTDVKQKLIWKKKNQIAPITNQGRMIHWQYENGSSPAKIHHMIAFS